MKYVFLILHYQNMDVTINCVKSIFAFYSDNIEIVIVDNNSPNGSGEMLRKQFEDNPLVKVLFSDKNLGFARGNNLGFSYIKENMSPNYIIMMNSDTELLEECFLKEINNVNDLFAPAVIGPQIILANGQLGMYPFSPVSKKHVKREIIHFCIKRWLYWLGLGRLVRAIENRNTECVNKDEWEKIQKNVVLNGCCLIFTSKYIERFDGIYDKTFMYKEEQFLYHRLSRSNLFSVYAPNIKIKHLEGSSTGDMSKNKAISFYTREIESDRLLIKYLNDEYVL